MNAYDGSSTAAMQYRLASRKAMAQRQTDAKEFNSAPQSGVLRSRTEAVLHDREG
jgi:hypothetical protein